MQSHVLFAVLFQFLDVCTIIFAQISWHRAHKVIQIFICNFIERPLAHHTFLVLQFESGRLVLCELVCPFAGVHPEVFVEFFVDLGACVM